jgi:hypothetical protein
MSGRIKSSSTLIYLFEWLKFLLIAFFVKVNCGCLFSGFALFFTCFKNFDLGTYTLQAKFNSFPEVSVTLLLLRTMFRSVFFL